MTLNERTPDRTLQAIERECYHWKLKGLTWRQIGERYWPKEPSDWSALKASCAASRFAAHCRRPWPLRASAGMEVV